MSKLQPAQASPGRPPFNFERWLYRLVSTKWCGNEMVPLDHDALEFHANGLDHVVMFTNDAYDIGFGWPEKWHCFYRREEFDRIVLWYIWKRCWSEWFGIRRWLYYKLLRRSVARHRKGLKPL